MSYMRLNDEPPHVDPNRIEPASTEPAKKKSIKDAVNSARAAFLSMVASVYHSTTKPNVEQQQKSRSLFSAVWSERPWAKESVQADKATQVATGQALATAAHANTKEAKQPNEEIEKLNDDIMKMAKGSALSSFFSDVKGLKAELERLPDYQQRVANASKKLTQATTEEQKTHAKQVLDREQNALAGNLDKTKEVKTRLKGSLSELSAQKALLEKADKKEAANKIGDFLKIFDESGEITISHEELTDLILAHMSTQELNLSFIGKGETLRAQTWEEDNLLRSPLNDSGTQVLQNHYQVLGAKLQQPENRQFIAGMEKSLTATKNALDEFHAPLPGLSSLKSALGVTDRTGHSYLEDQDLSSLSNDQLKELKNRALQLKETLADIQAEMRALPHKKEGEPLFTALFGVHGQLESPLCKLTGEAVQMLGKPPKVAEKAGQIDVLLDLIDKAQAKRT